MFTGEMDVVKTIKLDCQNAVGETCGVELTAGRYHLVTLKPNKDGTFDILFDAGYKGEEVTARKVCLDKIGAVWMGDQSIFKKDEDPPVEVEVESEEEKVEIANKTKWF